MKTDMYVTTTGAGAKNGINWANAFDFVGFGIYLDHSVEKGDRYFFEAGAYPFTPKIDSIINGGQLPPIEIRGVVAGTTAEPPTSVDYGTVKNRPVFSQF